MYSYRVKAPYRSNGIVTMLMVSLLCCGDVCSLGKAEDDVHLSPRQFFQLRAQNGQCLTLSDTEGRLSDCTNEFGDISKSTIYRLHGAPGNQRIELFGSSQCLDREHCHSSTSNLRSSDCSHCGAIHWDLRKDGTLREDKGLNCIYAVQSANTVEVHHTSDGCTPFKVAVIGDSLLLKTVTYGDCLSNGVFTDCESASRFMVFGLPYNYQFRNVITGTCLDREHCHFSTSNIRLFDCTHCGAIHWSIDGTKVGEDSMQNCVDRGQDNAAVMAHCSDGWEKIIFEIFYSIYASEDNIDSPTFLSGFPKADVSSYTENLTKLSLRGLRIYKDELGVTSRLEFVQALPIKDAFSVETNLGVYQVRYWVTTIVTNEPYDTDLLRKLTNKFMNDPEGIRAIYVRYGAVDDTWLHFGENDGLISLFVTDDDTPGEISRSSYDAAIVHLDTELKKHNWWLSSPSVHHQKHEQTYFNFRGDTPFHQALYWPVIKRDE
ncbi:uncharacterized protein [Apostichopus japonicus]|uniref:uncharacterized protein n=1 Tax=Stichopus japonicus TaxID=307972 RepID=UPI003AB1258B